MTVARELGLNGSTLILSFGENRLIEQLMKIIRKVLMNKSRVIQELVSAQLDAEDNTASS
jgi:hypothetical protein